MKDNDRRMTEVPYIDQYVDQAVAEAITSHLYTKASRIVKDELYQARQTGRVPPKMLHHADELARVYCDAGDYATAASLYRLMEELQRYKLGPTHPDVESTSRDLIAALMHSGYINPGNA